ncbi:hypothetical protein ACFP1I_20075 [Dyadobacter subterraneus]|uniref:Uncharacterized protein n=1 Tax=Dyadobacter subterraneus TaxID=2773304 RepID=A0ABR9W9D5_9BACT|nr:hypothetical protein [Dyadobacter subterraneus]MBE9460849.1 hypothetical protein [Dyadobacter subterraneus]
MIKVLRNIAILGEGITNFNEKYAELEKENPTEAVIIDSDGIVNAYTYEGFAFLNENWYQKYSPNWQTDSSAIDKLLTNLVRSSSSHSTSVNLTKIKDYLSSPPETIEETIKVWKTFYDPHFRNI